MHLTPNKMSGTYYAFNKCCFVFSFQYICSQLPHLGLILGLATSQLCGL